MQERKTGEYIYRGNSEQCKKEILAITFTGVTANNARKKYYNYLYRGNNEQCKKEILRLPLQG